MGVSESDDEPMGEEPVVDEDNDLMAEEEGSIEDTDEEEEDVAQYEDDGFVVDSAEEDAESDASSDSKKELRSKRKRRKRRAKHVQLDEDDYSLLEENNIRAGRSFGARRFLKKASGDAAGRLDASHARRTQVREDLDDYHDDEGPSYPAGEDSHAMQSFAQVEDEMEMDDFIVDEAPEQPSLQKRRPRDRVFSAAYQEALQEVADIFGEADELVMMYEKARQASRENPDHLEGLYQARSPTEELGLDGTGDGPSILDQYDPEALAVHYLLPKDDEIRNTDVPERFQERMGPGPENFEYDLAAEWIYDCLMAAEDGSPEAEILENGQLEVDGASFEEDYCGKNSELPCAGQKVVRPVRVAERKERWKHDGKAQSDLKTAIERVLKHLYDDREEVPYIATYRKQSCGELVCLAPDEVPSWTTEDEYNLHKDEGLHFPPPGAVQARNMKMKRWQVLWVIYELSLKWRRLRSRVEKRVRVFLDTQKLYTELPDVVYGIGSCVSQMNDAFTSEAADLADRRFRLIMGASKKQLPTLALGSNGDVQRYCMYCDMGYRTIVEGMGLHAFLELEVHQTPKEASEKPLCCSAILDDVVADIMQANKGVVGVDAVLRGARHVAAMELACHPYVQRAARKIYAEHATVTTTPTELGEKVLDPFHIYGSIKRLVEKPVLTFKGDAFLKIIGATRSGYVSYSMEIKDSVFRTKVLPVLTAEILRMNLSPLCKGWEDFREEVVEGLATLHLFPALQKAMIQKLAEKARSCVLGRMAESLWKFVIQGPFKPAIDENNYEEQDSMVRVCACCWGQGGKGQPNTVLVMLDSFGELKDTIELKQFSGFFEPPAGQDFNSDRPDVLKDEHKRDDAQRIREFLMEHKPHVVVVGGAHMICKKLVEDLEFIRDHFLTEHSRFMVSIQGNMEVLLLSEMLPAIWENSPAARAELPDHGAHVRRAVALGRCLIDPLSVVASLRDHSNTILSVGFTDLQELIIKEERLARIDQVMVTAANQLGAELNLMANVQWRAHALPFIAGLGPRKAQGLVRYMHCHSHRVESRADLKDSEQLGPSVLKNCIGFLIINDSNLPGMQNIEIDPLDETRIHVEHYSLAREMAMMAVETRDPDAALVELVEKPYLIRRPDLDWFNKKGVSQGREDCLGVLIDIGMELFAPFCDRRPVFSKPNELEVFYILLNEKAETMKPGKLVEAMVEYVDEHEICCSLVQSQLRATIKREQFSGSEDAQQIDLKSRVRRGDIISARLVGIEYQNFLVELSCRSVDLGNDERWEQEYCTDPFYRIKTADEKEQERLSKESKQEKRFVSRRIDHPLFRNISKEECVDLLARSPPGYTILHPSTEGHQYITLSFTAFSGKHGDLYLHRDMKEGPKGTVRGMQAKLGLPLTMTLTSRHGMKFDDLDEVVPCFVDPYIERVKALKMHRKFRDGYGEEVHEMVKEEKRRVGPRIAAYCLAVDYRNAGWYYICSCLNVRVRRESFMIVPAGYYFRKDVHRTLESMITRFKEDPVGEVAPPDPSRYYPSSGPRSSPPPQSVQGGPAGSDSSDDAMRF